MPPSQTAIIADELNTLLIEKFPLDNSLIPLSIILKTIRSHFEDRDLSLKQLYSELKSSEIGTRIHIEKLANTNWLKIEKSTNDHRVKLIKPTTKMLDTFNSLSNEIRHQLLRIDEKPTQGNFKSLSFLIKH